MAYRSDLSDRWTQLNKGDWFFRNGIFDEESVEDAYIVLRWGDNESDVAVLKIKGTDTKWEPVWQWNGDKESPTLAPSIRVLGKDGMPDLWHGYLRNGKLENA